MLNQIDIVFAQIVATLEIVLFFSIGGIPLIILWMIGGGIFFTLRYGFISLRGLKDAIDIATGKYESDGEGEVSSFQALATALSGTVGLGNIAGVAIAIQVGGAGSVFWMSVAAFLGMSSKFIECTLGQQYRQVNPDGTVAGGPMYYLEKGLADLGFTGLGKLLGVIFALFCIGASFGGGNMFQVNQSFAALTTLFPSIESYNWVFGITVALLVGLVIIGGINRIGVVTSKLVPLMIGIYLIACLWVIASQITQVPNAIINICQSAFSADAMEGGLVGLLILAIRRSAFSNGAGMGTAAIAHSAAKTQEPIQEGLVSMLEPFIDTIVICNLTALVIILTGTYGANIPSDINGSELTALAFSQVLSWFPYVLAIVIFLFGFSTTVAWSYYGEKSWVYLFGDKNTFIYKIVFLICIFVGAVVKLGVVVEFSDMMLLAMAVPNIIGCVLLSNKVAKRLKNYQLKRSLESQI
ncbi:MAG: alanine/glycine:cation symporter family protein [Xenococcaceae cyanobacterium MO_167.B52]|nr:alanine/glycine:cation symporter family protein [Xenococcaceae cyanobacterium MO_167.B52]